MAHFMLYTQIKKQAVAFLKGFHSVISPSWIRVFSPTELQSLISGEEVDINVEDLRYTQLVCTSHFKCNF